MRSRDAHPFPPDSPEAVALARTRARMALRGMATLYVTVCTGLVAIWALTPARIFWPGFVIVGWGAALLVQAVATRTFVPGSAAWRRVHAEELERARSEPA